MTREELILTLEQYCQKTEADLAISKQALSLLKGGIYAPEHAKKLRNGPIVYGNGHHDGKKLNLGRSGSTTQVRAVIEKMLRVHPEGLTVAQMTERVEKAGIPLSKNTIHNALRKLDVLRLGGTGGKGGKPEVYALPNIQ